MAAIPSSWAADRPRRRRKAPPFHIFSLYFTPELAILAGNVFSYLVSPKAKLVLTLKEKLQ